MSVNRISIEEAYLRKKKEKSEGKLKGDKLRDLIFLIHLNNKYGHGKNEIAELKETLGYSTGGIYNAVDNSGYFERTVNGIQLTEKGKEYLDRKILPRYSDSKSVGNALMLLGFVFILQWVEWTYFQYTFVIPWYSGLTVLVGGIILRFFILRLYYLTVKRKKKMPSD